MTVLSSYDSAAFVQYVYIALSIHSENTIYHCIAIFLYQHINILPCYYMTVLPCNPEGHVGFKRRSLGGRQSGFGDLNNVGLFARELACLVQYIAL